MGKHVNSSAKRAEFTALNTKVNKELLKKFKDYCKELGYPMNVMLETFMNQYANERFDIRAEDILKWKEDRSEDDILNSTFNKEIYAHFKSKCKSNGYFVKYVVTAFMEKFVSRNLVLEYVDASEIKK